MSTKLNVLLAKTDALRVKYKNMLGNMTTFFRTSQGQFLGEKSTFVVKEGMDDEPSKRIYKKVVTTVNEKLDYFVKESGEFINALFSQEKTNSSGLAKASLIVDGENWGEYTSLELLRLKSLLESSDLGDLEGFLSVIPVRSDAAIWAKTTAEEYTDRNIWESPLTSGTTKTTTKEEYILEDPNLISGKAISQYTPKTSWRTRSQEVGDYTHQLFTGEWSQREKAGTLKRRNDLLVATIVALKECNDCEVVSSSLTAEKIFGYILGV